jgi:hypothetical protein
MHIYKIIPEYILEFLFYLWFGSFISRIYTVLMHLFYILNFDRGNIFYYGIMTFIYCYLSFIIWKLYEEYKLSYGRHKLSGKECSKRSFLIVSSLLISMHFSLFYMSTVVVSSGYYVFLMYGNK